MKIGQTFTQNRIEHWSLELSVDINARGDKIIIGVAKYWRGNNDDTTIEPGFAQVFNITKEKEWQMQGQIMRGIEHDYLFGAVVAVNAGGDRVMISGHRYFEVFEFNKKKDEWEQIGQTVSNVDVTDADINDRGDTIIVCDSDTPRVYRFINGQWRQQGQDLGSNIDFCNVRISGKGDRAVVGDPSHPYYGGDHSGHVKVFKPSSCVESPLKVLTTKNRRSGKTCSQIANYSKNDDVSKFCMQAKIKSHCPDTCRVCDEYKSSDSKGTFLFDNNLRDCKWVKGNTCGLEGVRRFWSLCQNYAIRTTCREPCSYVVLFPKDDA